MKKNCKGILNKLLCAQRTIEIISVYITCNKRVKKKLLHDCVFEGCVYTVRVLQG